MERTTIIHRKTGGPTRGPEGCEGFAVLDPMGTRVGYAERLFANPRGEPEYIRVRTGFWFPRSFLLPVQDVAVDEGRRSLTLK